MARDVYEPCFGRKVELSLDGRCGNGIIEARMSSVRRRRQRLRRRIGHIVVAHGTWDGNLFTVVDVAHDFQAGSMLARTDLERSAGEG